MFKNHVLGQGALFALVTLVNLVACSSATENGEGKPELVADDLAKHPAPAGNFTDDTGKSWVHVGKVQYLNETPKVVADTRADPDMSKMTEAELVEHVRPRMEYGGHEYRLADADALELARTIRSEINAPSMTGSAGEVPEGVEVAQGIPMREGRAVYDGESRININYAGTTYPYSNHAQMLGGGGTCTAFKMVNNYTAITAAHCVHNGSSWLTRKDLTFQAGSSSPKGTLPGNCYEMTVPGCWSGSGASCDYAVLRLRGTSAWCNFADYDVGYLGWNDVGSGVSGIKGFLSGYPSDQPLPAGWVYPSLAYDYRENGWTSWPTYPDHVWYYNDSTGGQSGTAYVSYWSDSSWRVRAVHHGEFCGASCSGDGRRMTTDLFSWFSSNAGH